MILANIILVCLIDTFWYCKITKTFLINIIIFRVRTKCTKIWRMLIFLRFLHCKRKANFIINYDVCYRICYSITRMRLAHDPVVSFCWKAVIAIDSSPPKAKSQINRYAMCCKHEFSAKYDRTRRKNFSDLNIRRILFPFLL